MGQLGEADGWLTPRLKLPWVLESTQGVSESAEKPQKWLVYSSKWLKDENWGVP